MVGRVVLLIAAFVVAALGALLVFFYAQQADDRAEARFDTVPVLVVGEVPVEAGTKVSQAVQAGAFVLQDLPVASVPEGALADTAAVEESTTLTTLFPGEVLLGQKLGAAGSVDRLEIGEGRIAASFTFGDPNRVADFIAPGSLVSVFLTRTPTAGETTDPQTGETVAVVPSPTTRLLMPEVEIIAIGGTTTQTVTTTNAQGQQETTETNLSLLTLSLTQKQAEQLILAQTLGELYLGLLTETSDITPDAGTNESNLFEVSGQ